MLSQENKLYIDTIGTVVELDTLMDIHTATKSSIKVLKPDGSNTEWIGSITGISNTIITYTTVSGDLDKSGKYKLQSYVEMPDWKGRGETVTLDVSANYR